MNASDRAIEILQKTRDGEDLAPHHLSLLQSAVNGWLTERGEVAFDELHALVGQGYQKPCFHGIPHLTIDHVGYVLWKGREVEHFDSPFAYGFRGHTSAEQVAARCRYLESVGAEVNTTNVIWKWEN